MDNRTAAGEIAARVYAERAAKCTPEERAKAREFLDLRNGCGFDEELSISAYTVDCRRSFLLQDGSDDAEPGADAYICAAIERGLCLINFYGGELYRIPSRREA